MSSGNKLTTKMLDDRDRKLHQELVAQAKAEAKKKN